jgi:hypothetical protein
MVDIVRPADAGQPEESHCPWVPSAPIGGGPPLTTKRLTPDATPTAVFRRSNGRNAGAKPALGVLRSHDTARRDISGRLRISLHLNEPHTAGWLCRSCWTTRVGLKPSAIRRT